MLFEFDAEAVSVLFWQSREHRLCILHGTCDIGMAFRICESVERKINRCEGPKVREETMIGFTRCSRPILPVPQYQQCPLVEIREREISVPERCKRDSRVEKLARLDFAAAQRADHSELIAVRPTRNVGR